MRRLKVDLAELAEAFDNVSPDLNYYLDLESGQVVLIAEETRDELKQIYAAMYGRGDEPRIPYAEALQQRGLPDWQHEMLVQADQVEQGFGVRYIRVPRADSHAGYQDMEEFLATVRDARLHQLLEVAIRDRGAFRRFKNVLAEYPQERERWFAFKDERLRERAGLARRREDRGRRGITMEHRLPNDILIRPPTLDDAPAVVELINACSVAEGGAPDMPLHRLLQSWSSGDLALEADAWVAIASDGQIVGYEEAQIDRQGASVDLDGYVHPNFKGRGVGTHLLRLAEARARAALPSDEPLRLRATIASANQAARQLFAAEGYATIRHFWRMEIELSGPPPAPIWPVGIAMRSLVPGQDERATHAALDEAQADHWDHTPVPFEEWEQAMVRRADFDPALWFLATDGDEVAGVALCFDSAEHGGWVRNLAVRARWRRHGLGLALLRHAFGAFYARGRRLVGLAVDSQSLSGATRLYERAGMHVTEQYDTCEKIIDSNAARSL